MAKAKRGNHFGSHRVINPRGVLPQRALKIDNNMDILYDNEILVDIEILNIDSASFTQIKEEAKGDEAKIREIIMKIVSERGKMQNPITGSGGVFIGRVSKIGERLKDKIDLKEGDNIASLVSLSLTPLKVNKIIEVKKAVDQVKIRGQAILFESGIYVKLPEDIPAPLALAVLDVCGAPAQAARLIKPGDTVAIIGVSGKSGVLCSYEAKKRAGITGRVIGIGHSDKNIERINELGFCDYALKLDATQALACYEKVYEVTNSKLADVVINCVNIPNTEMASILICKDRGIIYFFSMATSFTKAALGAEGVGKDVDMMIGNGYAKGHAEITLDILRESKKIRRLYEKLYC